ncbi:FG-GAP repeat protein [Planctomycetes bacterium Pla163]|uniref:FG-GAP repeat protein n=1 Tax=Rohdeia mirabilis TaxID=2528008 RepID=A0A518D4M0_9BACT|nr:FG-GAP repeat protein [Planctomycetes bacterium Pla163]
MTLARRALPALLVLVAAVSPALSTAAPATAQSTCTADGAFELLGGGTPGAHGAPRLVLDGAPLVGRPFGIRVEHASSLAAGYLGLGAFDAPTPLPNFGAVAHPGALFLLAPFTTSDSGTSAEIVALAAVEPYLCGVSFVAQAFVVDATAQGGLAFTGGRRVAFGAYESGPLFRDQVAPSAFQASHVQLADFDEDGWLDALVFDDESSARAINAGLEGGSFEAAGPSHGTYGGSRNWRRAVDIDQDGHLDLVSTRLQLVVELGNGDGTFQPPVILPAPVSGIGSGPYVDLAGDLEIADVDGDGDLDVLATASSRNALYVARNDGAGGFTDFVESFTGPSPQSTFVSETYPHHLAVGDLDGDGVLDAVTTNPANQNHVILLGAGDGTFAVHGTLPWENYVTWFELRDANQDGALDLLVLEVNTRVLRVHLGDGTGGFASGVVSPLPSDPTSAVYTDFDGDGIADLLVGLDASSADPNLPDGRLLVMSGSGGATFHPGAQYELQFGKPGIAAADLDGDGLLDLAYVSAAYERLATLMGSAPGAFERANRIITAEAPRALATADVNLDGYDDAITLESDPFPVVARVVVRLGSANGLGLAVSNLAPVGTGTFLVVQDATSDGICDLIERDGNALLVRAGDGSGAFGTATVVKFPTDPGPVEVADVDGDGRVDLVAHLAATGEVAVLRGLDSGGWTSTPLLSPLPYDVRDLELQDLDGDGVLDLVAAAADGPPIPSMLVATGHGDGTFGNALGVGSGAIGLEVTAADLNGDGLLDLAAINDASWDLSVVLGHPSGHFVNEQRLPIGFFPSSLDAFDANGDGHTDLVAYCGYDVEARVWLGDGGGAFTERIGVVGGRDPYLMRTADVDGDGLRDLLVLSSYPREIIVHHSRLLR